MLALVIVKARRAFRWTLSEDGAVKGEGVAADPYSLLCDVKCGVMKVTLRAAVWAGVAAQLHAAGVMPGLTY